MSWFLLSVISVFAIGIGSLIFICLGKPNQSAPNVLLRGLYSVGPRSTELHKACVLESSHRIQ